jgi:di/tricarboxylate transporter
MAVAANNTMTPTYYATGTSPRIFGSGHTMRREGWKTAVVMGPLRIGVWRIVRGAW